MYVYLYVGVCVFVFLLFCFQFSDPARDFNPEPELVNFLRSPGIDSQAAGPKPVFLNVYKAQESIPRNDSTSLCSLAGRYDKPIPTRCLDHIDGLKIPAQYDNPI